VAGPSPRARTRLPACRDGLEAAVRGRVCADPPRRARVHRAHLVEQQNGSTPIFGFEGQKTMTADGGQSGETTRSSPAHRQREGRAFRRAPAGCRPRPGHGRSVPAARRDGAGGLRARRGRVGAPDHPHRGLSRPSLHAEASSSTRTRPATAACSARATCSG